MTGSRMTGLFLMLTALLFGGAGCALYPMHVLPDVQFGRKYGPPSPAMALQQPRPVEERPQEIPFERLVLVEMPWGDYRSAEGTVFHLLEHGCGLTAVKPSEPPGERRGWLLQPKPVPHHKYRLELTVSDKRRRADYGAESYAEATANLFDDTARVTETAQFVRTGAGVAYYGPGRDAFGNPLWVGPQRTFREAAESAIRMAVQALCYGMGSSHVVGPPAGRVGYTGYRSDHGGSRAIKQDPIR